MLKKLTPGELRRLQMKDESIHLEGVDIVVGELEKFYKQYFQGVQNLLLNVDDLEDSTGAKLVALQRIADQLDTVLVDAGLEDVLAVYRERYPEAARQALTYFELFDITTSKRGIDLQSLETLIELQVDDLIDELDRKLIKPIKTRLVANTLGTKTARDIARDISKEIDDGGILRRDGKGFTDDNIGVLVDESVARFQQKVRADRAASLGMSVYEYRGPLDGRTRDACRFLLSYSQNGAAGFYYADEITAALHPDLTGDPIVTRGGFRCRHTFYPVPIEYAVEFGFIDTRALDDAELEREAA